MFSFIPPFHEFEDRELLHSLPVVFQIFHSTASTPSYRSVAEERSNETHCIFHYTVRGQGEAVYQGQTYSTSAGQGFFNIINEPLSGYGYPDGGTEPWEFVVVCFRGGNTREIVKELMEKSVIYDLSEQNTSFCHLCKELLRGPSLRSGLITFLTDLIALIASTPTQQNPTVEKFEEIVKRDLLINPTIATIASEMQLSREHLQREYVALTGISPAKYLRGRRFERLCDLLSSELSEEQVADMMNFPSVAGMRVFFKQMAGISPRQYRLRGYFSI